MTADERKAAENFQNMLKTLVEAEQKALNEHLSNENDQDSYDRATAEAFIEQLKASFFCQFAFEKSTSFRIVKVVFRVTMQIDRVFCREVFWKIF